MSEHHCIEKREISSNYLLSNFFSKNVAFTKFFPKMRDSKFPKLTQTHNFCHALFFNNFEKFTEDSVKDALCILENFLHNLKY